MMNFMVAEDFREPAVWYLRANYRFAGRRPKWAERLIRRLVSWAGGIETESPRGPLVRTFRVSPGRTLLERMRLQERDLWRLYDQRAKVAFVGPEVMDGFTSEMRAMSVGIQPLELHGPQGLRVCGVEIIVIPWMTGALLVPELK